MIINKIKNISKIMTVSFLLSFILISITDVFATNYNYDVNQNYMKNFGGNDLDSFYSVNSTTDGGVIAVGITYSTDIEGVNNKGGADAIMVKYDKQGNQQWIKSFGGNSNDYFNSAIETNDNGFIAVGRTYSTDIEGIVIHENCDAMIVKYDKFGNQQWVKSVGGNALDSYSSVIQTVDNSFIVMGVTYSTSLNNIINKGYRDAFISKYDENGELLWIKSWGGNDWDSLYSILQTRDNGFIAVGNTNSTDIKDINTNFVDAIAIKYDKDGNQEWVKSLSGNDYDAFLSVIQTDDHGFIIAGDTSSTNIMGINNNGNRDIIIVKYDEFGNQEWIKSFGGNDDDWSNSIVQTNDNGFAIIGNTFSTNINNVKNKGKQDGLIIKCDKNGNQEWIKSFGGNNNDIFNLAIYTSYGDIIIAGASYSTDISGFTLNDSVNALLISFKETKTIIPEQASTSLNLEIVADNSLEMSISTNKISFEGYNGIEDLTNDKLSLTVSSGLYYDLYATLDSEIRGTNDTNAIIDKANLKIKTSDDLEYKSFTNIGEKVNLVANYKNGKDILHNINLKLLKDSSVKADTYNTNITFEVIQK